MIQKPAAPQYLQIALDVALRVSRGELPEGQKMYGRSVMAAEYGVSPETIRRAMKILADVEVVKVQPQSGILISSRDKATEYIQRFGGQVNMKQLQTTLVDLLEKQRALGREIAETARRIAKIEEHTAETAPFQNYEILVPDRSPIAGQSLSGLHFWQETGTTIIAIRRGGEIILSPGPYAQLQRGDVVILVGPTAAIEAAERYISGSN